MNVKLERAAVTSLSLYHPLEDSFLKEWFKGVIAGFEMHNKFELSPYENSAINYEFRQDSDFLNKIEFLGEGHVTLITEKLVVDYKHTQGYFTGRDIVLIMKRARAAKRPHAHA